MNTKLKGDIGQLTVATVLIEKGWHVAFPYGENLKYDLIAEKDGLMKRIQVKSVMPRDGVLHINCRSSNNWSVIHYKPTDFELIAAVNLVTKEVYFITSDKMRKSLMNIRISPPRNSQKSGINFEDQFRDI